MTTFRMALAALLATGIFCESLAPAQQGRPPAPVVATPIVEREVAAGQTFVGTVHPMRRASVGSAVDGRVLEFPVNEGDRVAAGSPLAQLRTTIVDLEVDAARYELELKQAELEELENGSRPEEIKQAAAQLKGAEALAKLTKSRYERTKQLYEQNRSVTDDDLEQAYSTWIRAEESLKAAAAAKKLADEGPRVERVKQARAAVDMQRAIVDRLAETVDRHTIYAPFGGYVIAEHTEVGQWLNRGELVAEVIELDQVDVLVNVLESQVPHIHARRADRAGTLGRIEVPALPAHSFVGEVALVVPQADLRSRTFPVKVRLDNAIEHGEPLLKGGMLARVTLPTGAVKPAFLVPKDALVLGGPSPRIVLFEPKDPQAKTQPGQAGVAQWLPVTMGVSVDRLIEIQADPEKLRGKLVVVEGNERLTPRQAVVLSRIGTDEPTAAEASQ